MALLYSEAARILEVLDNKKGTVKSLCLSSKAQNKKQLYALVCETLKYRKVIVQVLTGSKLVKLEKALTTLSAQVLVYDFLFGRGVNGAPKKLKDAILKHKSALKSELARLKITANVKTNKDLLSDKVKAEVVLPRYVRVNTLKTSVDDVIQHFTREGFTQIGVRGLTYDRFIETVSCLKPKQFVIDMHIPELLVFARKTDLHAHVLYTCGDIILQDKASCLPAYILAPPPGSHVIDCCAAPGNKTTHAANYLGNQGKIFSFDLDARRLATMATMTLKAGVLCADLINQDFLKVSLSDPKFAKVTHALVDPSCSGSGIVSRMNTVTDDEDSISVGRLEKLAKFQQSILTHALSFPAIQRVVYSTCSVHEIENEAVVKSTLHKFRGQFKLVCPSAEGLSGHGVGQFPGCEHCVRMEPTRDRTNGFFVACFERVPPGEDAEEWPLEEEEADKESLDSSDEEQEELGVKSSQIPNKEQPISQKNIKNSDQKGGAANGKGSRVEKGGVTETSSEGKKKKRKRNKKKKKASENQQTVENTNPGDADEKLAAGSIQGKRPLDTEGEETEPNKKVKMTPKSESQTVNHKKKKQKRKKKNVPITK